MAAARWSERCTDMSDIANKNFVLAAVGTDHHPFDRFVEWVDRWQSTNDDCEVFVQRGTTELMPTAGLAEFLEPAELGDMMKRAAAIVCHGGPSTIMEARRAGVMPIVVPRDPTMGEHVDDHQLRFTDFMARKGAVLPARSEAELSDQLRRVVDGEVDRVTAGSPEETLANISAVVDRLLSTPARPRRLRLRGRA